MGMERFDELTKFVCYVMWLSGFTASHIAVYLRRRGIKIGRLQVKWLVARSPYANRSAMSVAERARYLSELKAVRVDGGALDDGFFEPFGLSADQLKRQRRADSEPPAAP